MKHAGAKGCVATTIFLATTIFSAAETQSADARIETRFFRFSLSPANCHCEIVDKQTQTIWRPERPNTPFGRLILETETKTRPISLTNCDVISAGNELVAAFHPLIARPDVVLRVRVHALADDKTLEFNYESDTELEVASLSLLDDVLGTTEIGKGYVVVPVREGLLVPADSRLNFTHRFDCYAYEGCHMQMLGVVQNGAAVLLTWVDPYVAAELKSICDTNSTTVERQRSSPSLVLRKSARLFRVTFLGKGDYVTIAND